MFPTTILSVAFNWIPITGEKSLKIFNTFCNKTSLSLVEEKHLNEKIINKGQLSLIAIKSTPLFTRLFFFL